MTPTKQVWLLSAVYLVAVIAAFALPRVSAGQERSLAAGAAAALTFFACGLVAIAISLYALVFVITKRESLDGLAFAIGLALLPISVAIGVGFWFYVQHHN